MNNDLEYVVLAVADLRADGSKRVTIRSIAAHLGVHYSTVHGRVKRAAAAGLLQYEPGRSNTLRLGPGITVHAGAIYREIPLAAP